MDFWLNCLVFSLISQFTSGYLVNVALRKPVKASSQEIGHSPQQGADGIKNALWPRGIIHTAKNRNTAWWTVDLQMTVKDATVEIYFRIDFKVRRNGVQLYTSAVPFSSYPEGQLCHTVRGRSDGTDIPDVVSVTCTGTWRYLMVYTNTPNNYEGAVLDFGEVTVLDCSNGTYGINCDKICSSRRCAEVPVSCDRVNGTCPAGRCLAGWRGADCTQECSNGTYGMNCDKLCSSRQCAVAETSCDRASGACPLSGCLSGWRGTDCTQACSSGMYGKNCDKLCTYRRCAASSTSCDPVTGACSLGGCQSGWRGTDCLEECASGTYGKNCDKLCSSRQCAVTTTSCNPASGACPPGGCLPGWKGSDCTQVDLVDKSSGLDSVTYILIGAGVGVSVILVVIGGILICLIKQGRIQWKKSPDRSQRSSEMPEVNNPTDPQCYECNGYLEVTGDYDQLDTTAVIADNTEYDVIQNERSTYSQI